MYIYIYIYTYIYVYLHIYTCIDHRVIPKTNKKEQKALIVHNNV